MLAHSGVPGYSHLMIRCTECGLTVNVSFICVPCWLQYGSALCIDCWLKTPGAEMEGHDLAYRYAHRDHLDASQKRRV